MRWKIEDTPERTEFRREFRDWLRSALQPGWMEAIDAGDEEGFQRVMDEARGSGWSIFSWMATIGASGYGAPLWPKDYGGLSGEVWMQQIVREELARYRLPTFGINVLGVGLAGPTIIAHGTEAQKERYLKKILTGEEIWCQLFSEPGSGSDLASLAARAVRDGDDWILNGQKVWTSLAQFSKFGLLLARSDPDRPKHEGLTYFIVDMKSPGVDIRPLKQITGSSEFNEVFFSDVRIPDSNRVGATGEGWLCARTTLANERDTIAGLQLDMTGLTGGVRKDPWNAFLEGVSDPSSPSVRQGIAQLWIEKEIKEITLFRASAARLRGQQPGPEGSINKVFNAELNQRRTNFAINAAGLAGIAWLPDDSAAEARVQAFLRARANTIEGGTSEVLRSQVAERVLGLPREVEVDRGVPWKDVRRNGAAATSDGRRRTTGVIFSDEQEMLRASVRSFLEAKSPLTEVRRLMETEAGYDPAVWKQMGRDLGLPGLVIPEKYNGAGGTFMDLVVVLEEMGRALFCAPYFSTAVLAAGAILHSGDEAACRDFLPGIARGETIAALALTEAGGRWDPVGVTLRASRSNGEWRLEGHKMYVIDGGAAELLVVAARSDRGVSLFAVAGDAIGLERRPLVTLDATRKQARLEFSGVSARLVGAEGQGWETSSRVLDLAAVALAAEQVGGADRCLEMASEYAKTRVQFGRLIGSFQAIKHKCTNILMEVESARSAAYYAAGAAAELFDELPVVAPMAKAYCSDAYFHAAAENIQIHGGIGFTWEHDAHLYFRRAKSSELLFGDPAYHRELLAQRIGV